MFNNFGLNKTQAWVLMAVLLLCFSIRPHTSYPNAQDNEDLTDVDGDEKDDDYPQVAPNEGENPEGEYAAAVEEAGAEDVENTDDKDCVRYGRQCKMDSECCKGTIEGYSVICRSPKNSKIAKCLTTRDF